MIIQFKLFESKNDDLQALADKISQLYKIENMPASVVSYPDHSLFEIIIDYGSKKPIKTLFNIEYFDAPLFSIQSFNNDNIVDFVKSVMQNYDDIVSVSINSWWINNLEFEDISNILEELSEENYEIFKNAKKYNL